MKKSNLITGIVYLLAGIVFLGTALLTDTKLDGLFFGFAGAGIIPGIMMIFKYCYWSSPKNKERYAEKLENEKIELHDELKEKLRDKSGRYAYTAGLFVIAVSMMLFAVLNSLEIVQTGNIIVLVLGGYLVFQIVIGIVIFNHLMKKYYICSCSFKSAPSKLKKNIHANLPLAIGFLPGC